MRERPILFSPLMVRKLLADEKKQTRRVIDTKTVLDLVGDLKSSGVGHWDRCPYGVPGDRLWVKEGWTPTLSASFDDAVVTYKADDQQRFFDMIPKTWKPPKNKPTALFMPRWASRITLEITDVRMQRIKSITEEDAIAEGARPSPITAEDISDMQISDAHPQIKALAKAMGPGQFTAKFEFQRIWDEINGKRSGGEYQFRKDPWVWAISFRRLANA